LTYFHKIVTYEISRKSIQWEQLFHTHGQTDRQADMAKLAVAFLNFVNAPKK